MPRPSRNTDMLLIRAARELLPKTGASGLNLRQVAKKAGVNLGMFHYNFGSKDEFIRRVLKDSYSDFFNGLNAACAPREGSDAMDQLKEAALRLGRFARDNRSLIVSLIGDILSGNQAAVDFVKDNMTAHIRLLTTLIKTVLDEKRVESLPFPVLLSFIAASVAAPSMIGEMLCRSVTDRKTKKLIDVFVTTMLDDRSIEARVDLAMKALSRGPVKRATKRSRAHKRQIKKGR